MPQEPPRVLGIHPHHTGLLKRYLRSETLDVLSASAEPVEARTAAEQEMAYPWTDHGLGPVISGCSCTTASFAERFMKPSKTFSGLVSSIPMVPIREASSDVICQSGLPLGRRAFLQREDASSLSHEGAPIDLCKACGRKHHVCHLGSLSQE